MSPATTKPARPPAANRRIPARRRAGWRDEEARRPRAPGRPLAIAGDAERRPRRARPRGGMGLRGDRRRPGRIRAAGPRVPGRGFVGANVTVPHKGAALALADTLSETAREIGAANTLGFEGEEIRADNTDAAGLLAALPASPEGSRALVLGAGGAARAVVWALLREGAEVEVWNRTGLRSRNLCEELGGRPVEEPDPAGYGLIVNSTAVGLGGRTPSRRCRSTTAPSAAARWWSTWSTGASPPLCSGRRGGGGGDRGRDRGPRPPGRALARALDRAGGAARRDAGRRPRLSPAREVPPEDPVAFRPPRVPFWSGWGTGLSRLGKGM